MEVISWHFLESVSLLGRVGFNASGSGRTGKTKTNSTPFYTYSIHKVSTVIRREQSYSDPPDFSGFFFFFLTKMYLVNEGNQKVRENLGICQVLKMFHFIPSERKVTDAESKLIIIHKSINFVCVYIKCCFY